MLGIAILDVVRILKSKTTWALLLLAFILLALQTVKEASSFSYAVNPSSIDMTGFVPFLSAPQAPRSAGFDVLARDAAPMLRLMRSFWYFNYLALAAVVIFGGFFAKDVRSGYALLRRCRGISPHRLFAANALTVATVSLAFSALGVGYAYAVCLAVNPEGVNSLTNGQMVLDQVFFLPQVAAAHPVLYVVLFVFLYTGVLTFLGMFGHTVARASGNVLVASVVPAGLIYMFGSMLAGTLPWPFRAFDFDNLAFAQRSITEPAVAFQFAGSYFVWIAIFLLVGVSGPSILITLRRVRTWLSH